MTIQTEDLLANLLLQSEEYEITPRCDLRFQDLLITMTGQTNVELVNLSRFLIHFAVTHRTPSEHVSRGCSFKAN